MNENLVTEKKRTQTIVIKEYRCEYCGSGADIRERLFHKDDLNHLNCVNCGAPAGEEILLTRTMEIPDISDSIFLVYADDAKEDGALMKKELTKRGVKVVTLEDAKINPKRDDITRRVADRFAKTARNVCFVFSPQSEGPESLYIDLAYVADDRETGRLLPVWSKGYEPESLMLRGHVAFRMDRPDEMHGLLDKFARAYHGLDATSAAK